MKIVRINSEVLKDAKSEIKHVNAYLTSVHDKQDSARLEELWDLADDYWKPVVAKFWGMLNPGKNLLMKKIEQGKAEMPESQNIVKMLVGDDIPDDEEDTVLVEEMEQIDEDKLTETNVPTTPGPRRGRGRPRKNP